MKRLNLEDHRQISLSEISPKVKTSLQRAQKLCNSNLTLLPIIQLEIPPFPQCFNLVVPVVLPLKSIHGFILGDLILIFTGFKEFTPSSPSSCSAADRFFAELFGVLF
jgi:hypothetical protein